MHQSNNPMNIVLYSEIKTNFVVKWTVSQEVYMH